MISFNLPTDHNHFILIVGLPILGMIWILIMAILLLLLGWLLLAPFELSIGTRIPLIDMRWRGVGKAMLTWENEEWMINFDFLFFHRKLTLEKIVLGAKKTSKRSLKKQNRGKKREVWQKFFRVLKSFRVSNWQLAMDSGDYVRNACLYPLNFVPFMRHHLFINFLDHNYLVATIKNTPWRMIYAWIKN